MATTEWKIETLECMVQMDGYDNVVYNIHWRLFAYDGDYSTSIYGSQQVSFDPDQPDYVFIPYADLDELTVLGWLETAFGPEAVAEKEALVLNLLDQSMNPVTEIKPLPWVN